MRVKKTHYFVAAYVALALPFALATPVFAADPAGVSNAINFIQTLVNILCSIAGPLCGLFLAINGVRYITSSGNPERLDSAKRGIYTSLVGLVIVFAALIVANGAAALAANSFKS